MCVCMRAYISRLSSLMAKHIVLNVPNHCRPSKCRWLHEGSFDLAVKLAETLYGADEDVR